MGLETGYNEVELVELACVNAGAEGRYGVDDGVGERGTDCARHGVAKRRQLGLRHPSQSCERLLWTEGGEEGGG